MGRLARGSQVGPIHHKCSFRSGAGNPKSVVDVKEVARGCGNAGKQLGAEGGRSRKVQERNFPSELPEGAACRHLNFSSVRLFSDFRPSEL